MKMRMSHFVSISLVTLLAIALPASGAGGGSVPNADPADQAIAAYDRGLGHRDKAWKLEEKAASTSDAGQKTKLEAKVRKEWDKAIRAFRSATDADSAMHQAFGSLGYALRKTGQFQESLAAYNQALQLQPDYMEAIEYRAEAFLGLNRLDEAKGAYMQLFRDDRERAEELMDAMQRWVEMRQADSAGLEPSTVEEFSLWVEERSEVSGSTASLQRGTDHTW